VKIAISPPILGFSSTNIAEGQLSPATIPNEQKVQVPPIALYLYIMIGDSRDSA
jgi:hypothetical protein